MLLKILAQANKKIKNLSEDRFFPGKERENVKIQIPADVDQTRCDFQSIILGVI